MGRHWTRERNVGFMIDKDLRLAATSQPAQIINGIDPKQVNTTIQGCAIDLHIGAVFRPGREAGHPGSANSPHSLAVTLQEGETAVVRTRETFKLDDRHAALVFPASRVSIQGLLMTNPGHVDPGYDGAVHVTVINMGREAFPLVPDERILRALVYELDHPVDTPKLAGGGSVITDELLSKLSPDFLSVADRTAKAAKREIDASVKRSQWLQFGFPALATLIGVIVTSTFTSCTTTARYDERIQTLEKANALDRLQKLELNYPTEKRLLELETQLKAMREAAPASKPKR